MFLVVPLLSPCLCLSYKEFAKGEKQQTFEGAQNQSTAVPALCFFYPTATYKATREESLIYRSIYTEQMSVWGKEGHALLAFFFLNYHFEFCN